jgi:hypothetical protein
VYRAQEGDDFPWEHRDARRGGMDLKKVMLLAAMLAMVLAAAAPSFAQTAVGGDVAVLQYSCDQIQAAVNLQYQAGEGAGAVDAAAQALNIDQQQVLACFGTAAALQDSTVIVDGDDGKKGTAKAKKGTVHAKKGTVHAKKGTVTAKAGGGDSAATAAGGALPPTGGAPLIALGAGALLVAGGLLARRIVR